MRWWSIELRPHLSLCLGPPRCVEWERLAEFQYLVAYFAQDRRIRAVQQRLGDPAADLAHLAFLHAASGERRSTDADAARFHWRIRVKRNRILVDGDSSFAQCL